ncbi:MAG: hypothetical protein CV045_07420 [Cyanobacteria bacterium M5B4]|nr:MAG: hypothetical protein CV045_07420 [Cyanobacteria bacterium M5B4]
MKTFNNIEVVYSNSHKYHINRVSNENFQSFAELLEKITIQYYKYDGAIGEMLQVPEIVEDFENLCSIIPVKKVQGGKIGKEEEFLDWEMIRDNWEQLVILFCNSGLTEDRDATPIAPPLLAKLNFLSTSKWVQKVVSQE